MKSAASATMNGAATSAGRRWADRRFARLWAGGLLLLTVCGCDVPAIRGKGTALRRINPATKRGYWLYLPRAFRPDRRWPLVITLHGMKPFDNATFQIHEWEPTADRHGFVVAAPDLGSPDLLGEFPLHNPNNRTLLKDELAVLKIIEEICREVPIRTDRILLSSWSSGGYVAHYLMNRHPALFAALGARESNFNAKLLDPKRVKEYRDKPILVFYGQNDIVGVKREAITAAQWYRRHHFDRLTEQEIPGLGHQRRPNIAADFFVRQTDIRADELQIIADPVIGDVPVTFKLGLHVPARMGTPGNVEWFFGRDRAPIGRGFEVFKRVTRPGYHPVQARITINGKTHIARMIVVARAPSASRP